MLLEFTVKHRWRYYGPFGTRENFRRMLSQIRSLFGNPFSWEGSMALVEWTTQTAEPGALITANVTEEYEKAMEKLCSSK